MQPYALLSSPPAPSWQVIQTSYWALEEWQGRVLWKKPSLSYLTQEKKKAEGGSVKPRQTKFKFLCFTSLDKKAHRPALCPKVLHWCITFSHPLTHQLVQHGTESSSCRPPQRAGAWKPGRRQAYQWDEWQPFLWRRRMAFSNLIRPIFLLRLVEDEVLELFMPTVPVILKHSWGLADSSVQTWRKLTGFPAAPLLRQPDKLSNLL